MPERKTYSRRAVIATGLGLVGVGLQVFVPGHNLVRQVYADKPTDSPIPDATQASTLPLPIPGTIPTPMETAVASKPEIEKFTEPFIFKRGDPDKPYMYATVDDCWERNLVEQWLAHAETYNVRLTFFPVAAVVRQNPDFWKDVSARGHGIYNHSINHPNLTRLTYSDKETQILGAKQILENTLGVNVPVLRPPFGAMDADVQKICQDNGIKIAIWTTISQGYTQGAHNKDRSASDVAIASSFPAIINGGIACMHAINPDINAAPAIIQKAQDSGLKLITMQEGLQ